MTVACYAACEHMLERYTWRHNSVLNYISETIKSIAPEIILYTDLPGQEYPGGGTIPVDFIITNLRPDLCIVDHDNKSLTIVELTIPFEMNITNAHKYKEQKYTRLIDELKDSGISVNYYAIEIGSRAYISKENTSRLKSFLKKFGQFKWTAIRNNICQITLLCSYVIFMSKEDSSWPLMPILKPVNPFS